MMFMNLKDIEGRDKSLSEVINDVRGPLMGIREASVVPFNPPPIEGIGAYGGFQFQLQQTGSGAMEDMEGVLRQFMAKAGTRPELQGLFSSFTARDPREG
jgi:HAE1 family hydrophobic/amphiphilic exporter-1